MKRILLLTEDFNEMTFLETLLKKLGFDALGIQNPSSVEEKALTMNPEMLILSDTIKGQSTHHILESLVSSRPSMYVILMKPDLLQETQHSAEMVHKAVKSPVDPADFIRCICSVAKLNEEQYLEKFYKLGLFKGGPQVSEMVTVKGKIDLPSDTQFIKRLKNYTEEKSEVERKKRFTEQLKSLSEPKADKVNHNQVVEEVKEYRQRTNDVEIQKIDEQRKGFVRALFKK